MNIKTKIVTLWYMLYVLCYVMFDSSSVLFCFIASFHFRFLFDLCIYLIK